MPGQAADLVDDDMRALINGPTSVICATADRMNTPDVTRVAGLGVVGPNQFCVLIAARAVAAVANITPGARCAISAGDMTNYRSIQWKGTVVQACEPTPSDIALHQRHLAAFTEGTKVQGMPWPTLLRLATSQQIPAERFITHHFALDDMIEAYDVFGRAAEKGALKVVLSRAS